MLNRLLTYRGFLMASCRREIKNRYLNSSMGFLWLFLNPVLLLAIYYFVFEKIFQIKFNAIAGHDFLAFMAVGLWPWVAFSEGLMSGTNAIDKHKDLLKKMAVPGELLVLIEVTVPYLIHGVGFVFILLVMRLLGQPVHLWTLVIVVWIYLLQLLLCYGLSLLLSGLQVFLKDIAQILTPVVMVWFYLTPIIYPPSLIPDSVSFWLSINPLSGFMNAYRDLLLTGSLPAIALMITMLVQTLLILAIGFGLFKRLSSRFEDMF